MSGPGDVSRKVQDMQRSGLFFLRSSILKKDHSHFFPVTPAEVLFDDVCLAKAASGKKVDAEEVIVRR